MSRYTEMTRAQRRVAIAREVMREIHCGAYTLGRDGYIDTGEPLSDLQVKAGETGKKWTKRLLASKSCIVCARGGMMLSKVAKFNSFDVSPEVVPYHGDPTTEALKDAFSERQPRASKQTARRYRTETQSTSAQRDVGIRDYLSGFPAPTSTVCVSSADNSTTLEKPLAIEPDLSTAIESPNTRLNHSESPLTTAGSQS